MKRLLFALLFCLAASPSWAAITFDAVTTTTVEGGSSITANTHTVGGGCSNPILLAGFAWQGGDGTGTISSVVATAGAMTPIATKQMAGYDKWLAFYYLAGATGAQDVTINWPSAVDIATIATRSYCGVDQVSSIRTPASASSDFSGGNPTVAAVSAVNDWVVDETLLFGEVGATLTEDAGQTARTPAGGFYVFQTSFVQADSDKVASSTTTTMNWTINPTDYPWSIIAVALKPASGAPAARPIRRRIIFQ